MNQIDQPLAVVKQLIANGKLDEALAFLTSLIKDQPNEAIWLFLYAQVLLKQGQLDKAIAPLSKSVTAMPNSPSPLSMLAQLYVEMSDMHNAASTYRKLYKAFPQYQQGLFSYAGFLQSLGDLSQAKKILNQLLQLAPSHASALMAVTALIDNEDQHFHLTRLLSQWDILEKNIHKVPQATLLQNKMVLCYALGDSLEKQRKYAEAFAYWTQANKIQLQFCSFRTTQMLPFFKQLKRSFAQVDYLAKRAESNQESDDKKQLIPIFIVGMPRSGSTLLEQMLIGHPKIESAGEIAVISNEVVNKLQSYTKQHYPIGIELLTLEQRQALADEYLQKLQSYHPTSRFIIDKLPANFQSIGLIKQILPHAIVIDIQRNSKAVALSIYQNYFAANEPYFCDLDELNIYMNSYQELMAFWKDILPDELLEISYEQLIKNPQQTINKILQKAALSWHDDCLDFQHRKQSVNTLSNIQTRQPIYTDSMEKWRNFESFLKGV